MEPRIDHLNVVKEEYVIAKMNMISPGAGIAKLVITEKEKLRMTFLNVNCATVIRME